MTKSHTNTRRAGDNAGELKIIPGLGLADLAGSGSLGAASLSSLRA